MTENVYLELIKSFVAIITAIITVVGAYLGRKKYKIKNKEQYRAKNNQLMLYSHPIFKKIELNKNIIKIHFTLENKGKEAVFREILINHMNIFKIHALKLCKKVDSGKIVDTDELYTESVYTLNNIIADLKSFYKDSNCYSQEEVNVLDKVMDKYNHWNSDRQQEIVARIQEICVSAFYTDIYNKSITVFDTLLFVMNDIMFDANKTLNNLNGDLVGLKFRGVII
ncbi:hypothetical protein Q3304_10005 [Clostridioides sp. GD02377]|uniref:hypothetical protein n=1 Tax=unclassified Clostridioides TaxID=2635829 RepID=UPI0038B13288